MGWGAAPWGASWGTGVGGEPGVSPWDMLFGRQQGRIEPSVAPPDGDHAFCLGVDGGVAEHLTELAVGDYIELKQSGDFDVENYIHVPIQIRGPASLATIHSIGVLTLTGLPLNNQTVSIGAKVYTFKTVITAAAGDVLIGVDEAESIRNLVGAILLGDGAGAIYGLSTTINTDVTAAEGVSSLNVTAIDGGPGGDAITTTETLSGSWGGATLSGGADTAWKISLRINGTERASRTFGVDAVIDSVLTANVSALAGINEVALRLELV